MKPEVNLVVTLANHLKFLLNNLSPTYFEYEEFYA